MAHLKGDWKIWQFKITQIQKTLENLNLEDAISSFRSSNRENYQHFVHENSLFTVYKTFFK